MHTSFINDPTVAEFYPRRLYANNARSLAGFCIVNNAAAPAYRDWDAATGLGGLMDAIRTWHQPAGDGSDAVIEDIARQMIAQAIMHGHLEETPAGFAKSSPQA